MNLSHELEKTMRLLAESETRIAEQQQRLTDLEAATSKAKAILREFEDTRLLIINHREALIRQLAQEADASAPPALEQRR